LLLHGSILGSPHYMAPEQIETPGDVGQRADIYSLGVVFYEMLTGELPIGRFVLPSEKRRLTPASTRSSCALWRKNGRHVSRPRRKSAPRWMP
jgi:serine/threonine protein kinase